MAKFFRLALYSAFNGEIDWDSADIRETLHTSSYTPNLDTHDYADDLTNEVPNGSGYTTGGQALTSKTKTLTAANSWGASWAAATAYTADWLVRPTTGNGFVYRVAVAGTSHATTEPTWPTVIGTTVVDQGVTWECVGRAVLVLTAVFPAWTGATFTARYLAIVNYTPGTAATRPLVGLVDFLVDKSPSAGSLTYTPSSQGALIIVLP